MNNVPAAPLKRHLSPGTSSLTVVGAPPALAAWLTSANPEEGGGFVRHDYELALIINPEVSEEEGRSTLERIEQIVVNNGGQVVKVNQWGRRRMAYPIEKHRDGMYVFMDLILTPESVAEIDRTLKVSEIVLRHMVKRRDPKVVQKEREERAEREARAAAAAESRAEEAQAAAPAEEPVAADEEAPVLSEVEEQDVPPALEESVEA